MFTDEDGGKYVFVGDYYIVIKRGSTFISETLERVKLNQPLTEEDKARMQKLKEEAAILK